MYTGPDQEARTLPPALWMFLPALGTVEGAAVGAQLGGVAAAGTTAPEELSQLQQLLPDQHRLLVGELNWTEVLD